MESAADGLQSDRDLEYREEQGFQEGDSEEPKAGFEESAEAIDDVTGDKDDGASGEVSSRIPQDPQIFRKTMAGHMPKPKTTWSGAMIDLWLPLTLPKLPKKGTWDVTRLKGSKYFFS